MSKNPLTMADVIDRLFDRLSATYGADWTRQWGATPISDVKSAWGHELAGYIKHLPAIAYALDSLPERVPNLIQFKNLCRAAPSHDLPELPAPKADPVRVQEALAKMKEAPKADMVGLGWAKKIVARKEAGDSILPYTLKTAREALACRGVA